MATPVLLRLRAETADVHRALEAALDLTSPRLTRDRYVERLARFYGYVHPWEAATFATFDRLAGDALRTVMAGRRKAHRLSRDLAFFRVDPRAVPACDVAPPGDLAAALGAAYVMEGATLGGAVIARACRATLGLGSHRGVEFFDSYGPDAVGPMWREFREALAAHACAAAGDADDAIVTSARATFAGLQEWLTGDR